MTLNCHSRTRGRCFLFSDAALYRVLTHRFPMTGMNKVLQADPHHWHPRPGATPREPWHVLVFGVPLD